MIFTVRDLGFEIGPFLLEGWWALFRDGAEPLVLAECKAPEIRIDERTLSQAVRYNSVLGARFVILTNGLRHYCCEYRDGKYVQLSGFPDFSAL